MASWKGRISMNMRELRFLFTNETAGSQGIRNFINNNYSELKLLNPRFPFLVRDGDNVESSILASYDFGKEYRIVVENRTEEDVERALKKLTLLGEEQEKDPGYTMTDLDVVQKYPDDPSNPVLYDSVGGRVVNVGHGPPENWT
eukprot:CAMPEP_0119133008 /NCGR_PEP_ID=MMETSP1310-20130426/12781_1 /TAXON_ID=464262 /ORGANISM="Genus nov. species nov., Strain RCC2339" /LENGTH=143 /DNA_ID=CAMNT_0007123677 /DNA_START=72 /DNA_END=503 /DNA_ORIENTATION=+